MLVSPNRAKQLLSAGLVIINIMYSVVMYSPVHSTVYSPVYSSVAADEMWKNHYHWWSVQTALGHGHIAIKSSRFPRRLETKNYNHGHT